MFATRYTNVSRNNIGNKHTHSKTIKLQYNEESSYYLQTQS